MPTYPGTCLGFCAVLVLGADFHYFSSCQRHIESRPFAEQGFSRFPVCLGQKSPTPSIHKLPYGSLHNSKIIKYCSIVIDIIISPGSLYFCFLFIHIWMIKTKATDIFTDLCVCSIFSVLQCLTARKQLVSKPQYLLVMHFFCLACVLKS